MIIFSTSSCVLLRHRSSSSSLQLFNKMSKVGKKFFIRNVSGIERHLIHSLYYFLTRQKIRNPGFDVIGKVTILRCSKYSIWCVNRRRETRGEHQTRCFKKVFKAGLSTIFIPKLLTIFDPKLLTIFDTTLFYVKK